MISYQKEFQIQQCHVTTTAFPMAYAVTPSLRPREPGPVLLGPRILRQREGVLRVQRMQRQQEG